MLIWHSRSIKNPCQEKSYQNLTGEKLRHEKFMVKIDNLV